MITQSPLLSSSSRSNASKVISFAPCSLTWLDHKLFVRAVGQADSLDLEALKDGDRLVECLKRSPVVSVELDSNLSHDAVLRWAEACGKAKKACYVKIPALPEILNKPNPLAWFLYKSFHRVTAIILAFIVLPILLLPVMYFRMSAFSLHKQWAISNQGRLFQMWAWKNQQNNSDFLIATQFILLTLINVIQGEILLGTPMPESLDKALSV
jgi:hypothetical protein